MRFVIRLLVLLPLLWVEGVWAVDCASSNYTLASQAQVDDLGATGCNTVLGDLTIEFGANVASLDNLATLTYVGGGLSIQRNDALAHIDGLANLAYVGDYIYISENAALMNLDGLVGLSGVPNGINIRLNPALTNIDGLANLTTVGPVVVYQNAVLTNLDGLVGLTSVVDGYLDISNNEALTNLDGLASVRGVVGDLNISFNGSLTNLDGLASVLGVEGDLVIRYNAALTNCQGIAPVLGWPDGPPDDDVSREIGIYGNGIGCNSIEEILASVPLRPPIAPLIVSTDYEDGKIFLRVLVSDNGGSTITGYEANCTDGTDTFTGTSTSSPITVSGLTNEVAYTCTVTATNSVGESSASAATDPITPEEMATGLPIWLLYQATQ